MRVGATPGAAVLVGLWACTSVESQERQILATTLDLSVLGIGTVTSPILEGAQTCPVLSCIGADCPPAGGPDFLDCFDRDTLGEVAYDGATGCYTFGRPGSARWRFSRRTCEAAEVGYDPVSDRIDFVVVSPEDVAPSLVHFETLMESLLSPAPGEAFPAGWHQPDGEPWRLAGPYRMLPALTTSSLWGIEVEVGYPVAEGRLEADGLGVQTREIGVRWIEVVAEPGGAADLRVGVGSRTWPRVVGTVLGVPPTDAASIEVVVGYLRTFPGPELTPFGARAVVRDAAGDLLWGAPVRWSLDEGLVALNSTPKVVPGDDHVAVWDACVPPEENLGTHRAVVRATLGELTATGEFEWTVAERVPDPAWVPSPDCVEGDPAQTSETGGDVDTGVPTEQTEPGLAPSRLAGGRCGCGAGGGPAWLALVASLVAVRRRSEPDQASALSRPIA